MTENSNNQEYELLKKSIETDLNIVLTQSAFSKKKTLDKLNQTLETCKENKIKIEWLNDIIFNSNNGSLYEILLNLLSDKLEKSKTVSLNYLLEIKIKDNLINNLIFKIETLINGNNGEEQIEELRYLYCKLISKIIENNQDVNIINMNTEKIVKIIKDTLKDSSPDQKEISSKLIQQLCIKVPNRINYYSSELISQLIINLGNRQQRVRLESLQALSDLTISGSIKIINTLELNNNSLSILAIDNSPNIRIRLIQCIEEWCIKIPTTQQYYEFLLPILITLSISEIKLVRKHAIESLNSISNYYFNIDLNPLPPSPQIDQEELIKSNLLFEKSESLLLLKQLEKKLNYFIVSDEDNIKLTNSSKQLILKFSKIIMKKFYKSFHDQELEQSIRDFKQSFIIAFIGYLGNLPSLRFIDAIIEIIIVRKFDHFDQIIKKTNEIIFLLGLLLDPINILISKINDKINEQYNEPSSSSSIDKQLISIYLLILKQYFIGYLNRVDIKETEFKSILNLIFKQFKFIIYKEEDEPHQHHSNNIYQLIKDFFLINSGIATTPIKLNFDNQEDNELLISLCKILILIDSNGSGSNGEEFEFIIKSWSINLESFQNLIEKSIGQLFDEILKKDKKQLEKQKSHLQIFIYILSKLKSNNLLLNKYSNEINLIKEKIN